MLLWRWPPAPPTPRCGKGWGNTTPSIHQMRHTDTLRKIKALAWNWQCACMVCSEFFPVPCTVLQESSSVSSWFGSVRPQSAALLNGTLTLTFTPTPENRMEFLEAQPHILCVFLLKCILRTSGQFFYVFYLPALCELLQTLSLSQVEDRWHSWPAKSALNERINSASLKQEIVEMETDAIFCALDQGFVNFWSRRVLPSFQGKGSHIVHGILTLLAHFH